MFSPFFATLTNHLLRPAAWARQELRVHSGKTARFEFLNLSFALQVGQDGQLRAQSADIPPAVSFHLTPAMVLEILADREGGWKKVGVEGDAEFAQTLSRVMAHLRWDIEEDLSHVVGDIAAHRLAAVGRSLTGWPGQAAVNLAAGAAEYFTEEKHILVTPLEAESFVRAVDELRDAVERLDQRVGMLGRGLPRV